MHAYIHSTLITGADGSAVWTDFVPEAILNPAAMKLSRNSNSLIRDDVPCKPKNANIN